MNIYKYTLMKSEEENGPLEEMPIFFKEMILYLTLKLLSKIF